jgi:hypothetical protein
MAAVEEIAQFALTETHRRLERGEDLATLWRHVSRRFPDATAAELQAVEELILARLEAEEAKREGHIN